MFCSFSKKNSTSRSAHYCTSHGAVTNRKLKRNEIAERKDHSTGISPHTAMVANVGDIISLARALRRRRVVAKDQGAPLHDQA